GTPFEFRDVEQPEVQAELATHWPIGKFPLLVDDGEPIMESSIIIEHVAPDLVPADREASREVRLLDRVFDNAVMTPMNAVVAEHLPFITETPDPNRIARARDSLDKIYPWLDVRMSGRECAAGDAFTLADCSGAPSLFYADWVPPIPAELRSLKAYRATVLARPS